MGGEKKAERDVMVVIVPTWEYDTINTSLASLFRPPRSTPCSTPLLVMVSATALGQNTALPSKSKVKASKRMVLCAVLCRVENQI